MCVSSVPPILKQITTGPVIIYVHGNAESGLQKMPHPLYRVGRVNVTVFRRLAICETCHILAPHSVYLYSLHLKGMKSKLQSLHKTQWTKWYVSLTFVSQGQFRRMKHRLFGCLSSSRKVQSTDTVAFNGKVISLRACISLAVGFLTVKWVRKFGCLFVTYLYTSKSRLHTPNTQQGW
jgi:hypothetical protein